MILGDGALPWRSWVAKPYEDAILSEEKRKTTLKMLQLHSALEIYLQ